MCSVRFGHVFLIALVIGAMISAVLLLSTLGIRKNMAEAIETPRVIFKLGFTLLLAITSTRLAILIGKPGVSLRSAALTLLLPLAALLIGIAAELFVVPQAAWGSSLEGALLKLLPCLRPHAVDRPASSPSSTPSVRVPRKIPGKAGAVAGLAASGIAATIYAWHCPDDSPLFLATWYSIGILDGDDGRLSPGPARPSLVIALSSPRAA